MTIEQHRARTRLRPLIDAVSDPEMGGVTIGDLGLVVDVVVPEDDKCEVTLTPTFLGCPALDLIRTDIERALMNAGVSKVCVTWVHQPTWTPARISTRGREQLAELGIAVANDDDDATLPSCPNCGESELTPSAPVGPTACRSVAWCRACRSVIEIMRGPIRDADSPTVSPVRISSRFQRGSSYAHV